MSASGADDVDAASPHAHDESLPPHVHARATPRERRLAEIGVLVTVLIWSANFVVVKAAIGELGPLTFTSLRYAVAAITLLLVLRWRHRWLRVLHRLAASASTPCPAGTSPAGSGSPRRTAAPRA